MHITNKEDPLAVLKQVQRELREGVETVDFEKKYLGQKVAPGVFVRDHVNLLRQTGNLEETAKTMSLKK